MVRGKYAKRLKESSNIVVLKPEVAAVFPNEDAVNSALLSLIKLLKQQQAQQSTQADARRRAPFSFSLGYKSVLPNWLEF